MILLVHDYFMWQRTHPGCPVTHQNVSRVLGKALKIFATIVTQKTIVHWLTHPLVPSSYKIDYVIVIKNFLSLEGHQNPTSGSKVRAILLKGLILPIGGASAEEGLRMQPSQQAWSLWGSCIKIEPPLLDELTSFGQRESTPAILGLY